MSIAREQRKQIAQETLKIQQQGFYTAPSGKRVAIGTHQSHSVSHSRLITPEQGDELVSSLNATQRDPVAPCEVINTSTVTAIIEAGKPVAALNFASAKNPGGGFLNGAMAQEEALAISSGLYNTLIKHMTYYDVNNNCGTAMYTDHAIYSPDVPFFRNADYELLEEPVTASILTLPAVNMGQVRQKRESIEKAKSVMKDRMRLALAVFASEQQHNIILGAYGCGVFGNHPDTVAKWWKELLFDESYGSYFDHIVFAVMDKPGGDNIRAFERIFIW